MREQATVERLEAFIIAKHGQDAPMTFFERALTPYQDAHTEDRDQ